MSDCPYCEAIKAYGELHDISEEHAFALADNFPVTKGHALVVPTRHLTWIQLGSLVEEEQAAILQKIQQVMADAMRDRTVSGFNIGVNIGEAAGQTIPHIHFHVIPRRAGDVADPTGGIRNIIPEKGNYKAKSDLWTPKR